MDSAPHVSEIPAKFQSNLDPLEDNILAIFMIVIGVISVAGNGIAVRMFVQRRKFLIEPEIFLVNIACLDIFLAVLSYPGFIVSAFFHHWVFGELGCLIYAATCYFLGIVTIFSLALLAVYRFVKVCTPSIGARIHPHSIKISMGFIYLYAFFWSILPAIGYGGYEVEPFGLSCTLEWKQFDEGGRLNILLSSIFCIFVPTFLIIFCHAAISLKLRRTCEMMENPSVAKQSNRAQKQFNLMSIAVCLGFIIAWMPYAFICLWSAYGDADSIPNWLMPLPVMLAKSSIAYNPIIYIFLTDRYKIALKEVWHIFLRKSSVRPQINVDAPTTQDQPC